MLQQKQLMSNSSHVFGLEAWMNCVIDIPSNAIYFDPMNTWMISLTTRLIDKNMLLFQGFGHKQTNCP